MEEHGIGYDLFDFQGTEYSDKFYDDGRRRFRKTPIEKPQLLKKARIDRNYSWYGASHSEIAAAIDSVTSAPDIVVISTMMTYWYPSYEFTYSVVKNKFPRARILVGGVYASLLSDHTRSIMPGVDVIKNDNLVFFDIIVSGISGRPFNCFGGGLNKWHLYSPSLIKGRGSIPVLFQRGCPFRCVYCASSMMCPGIESRDPGMTAEWVKRVMFETGHSDMTIFDDAFFYMSDDRAKPLLRRLDGLNLAIHSPNGLHARWVDRELAVLMRQSGFKTVRLSLETTDSSRQNSTGGKVDNERFEAAVKCLNDAGFEKKDLWAYLIAGLPGQEPSDVFKAIAFARSMGIGAYVSEYSPIPGTQLFAEALKIAVQDITEPLFQNNTLLPWWNPGYPRSLVEELKQAARETR